MEEVSASTFKATCLELLKKVQRTGQPILITRRGEPVAEVVPAKRPTRTRGWVGSAKGTGKILGDIVEPTGEKWEALGDFDDDDQ
ncbi:MAG TPA: type II toxin-antitoxin system Phd/YefM family antitoxin [Kofleriaceae bacterium]|nr:type II toxin-antitoxin system Phd/YefM family antitoxin [Kofleriaceae bacterium]